MRTFPWILVSAATLVGPAASQALLLRHSHPIRVDVPSPSLHRVLAKVVHGPHRTERALGLRTAIPAGTALVNTRQIGDAVEIVLSENFLPAVERTGELELALEQLNKSTILAAPSTRRVQILLADSTGATRTLESALAPPARFTTQELAAGQSLAATGTGPGIPGALSGKVIAMSAGHGYYWHSSLGWTTQRPLIDGLIEDIHTNEIAMRFLLPYLENMGAAVISCRERGEVAVDAIRDNDDGAPTYTESGAWFTSSSSGYNGGSYRFSNTVAVETATATWQVPVAIDGLHPVYAWFRASGNRTTDARYRITHTGGVEEVSVDQTRDNLTWVYLGSYWFDAANGATITLSNESSDTGVAIIADAVRVGAGVGTIPRGSGTSGQAKWRECSRYWAQFSGAPSSVWNSVSGGQDNSDDVTCRPRFAEWRGADAFVSLHTNAGGGTGTSSFIYNGGATPGSSALQNAIHTQIVGDIRSEYFSTWTDRGQMTANFGEVRLLSTMPGVLLELAFHDTPGLIDHDALHDPVFRRIGGRAIARGILRYFDANAPFPPEPPIFVSVEQDGNFGLDVTWLPRSDATHYTIEQSTDGKGFTEVGTTTASTWNTGVLPFDTVASYRVRSWNATGRSFPTEVLTAGTSHKPEAELLLVQAFDRLERTVKSPDNTFDYLRLHGDAIRRGNEFSLAFDATTNDAIRIGLVTMNDYRAVDWASGEESTQDSTFDILEQQRVTAYLAQGGRLLVTGSEIGWDLAAQGNPIETAFYHAQLGANFVADDANTYFFRGVPGGIFADIPLQQFDSGNGGTYDVDWPDVLQASDGNSTVCLEYSNGLGAGIQRIAGSSRVVNLGFPLETIVSPDTRADVMSRALRFLLDGRALEVPATIGLGSTAPISIHMPADAGRTYALGASFGTGPLPLPNGQLLALAGDVLMATTLGQSDSVFAGFAGVLDPGGNGAASFSVPNQQNLVGLPLVISGLTIQSVPAFDWGTTMPWYRITIE